MRRFVKWLTAPMVLALALSACDSAQQLTSPTGDTPQFGVRGGHRRAVASVQGGSAVLTVGPSGGCATVNATDGTFISMLCVPAGVVGWNTTFTMDVASDYTVELTATSQGSAVQNNVGKAGFRKPVYLYLNPALIEQGGNLGIAEITANGMLAPVRSWLIGGRLVGELRHFSGYGPTTDRSDPPPPPPCEETPEGCS